MIFPMAKHNETGATKKGIGTRNTEVRDFEEGS